VTISDLEEFPASIGQRLLWVMERHRGANGALNCPILLEMRGPVDTAALQAAVDRLVTLHESLRTTFIRRDAQLRQVISPPQTADFAEIPLIGAGLTGPTLREAVLSELRAPIDVSVSPLRVRLFRLGANERVLCINVHHLATDAWSNGILCRDLGREYEHLVHGTAPPSAPAWHYRQFVQWQQEQLSSVRLERLQHYWRTSLQGVTFPILPARSGSAPSHVGAYERILLQPTLIQRLERISRSCKATLFTAMLTLYFIMMEQRTGQADQAVVSIFANRPRPELQETVGFLANPLILRTLLPSRASFRQLVGEVRRTALEAFVNQELPYQMLPFQSVTTASALDLVFQVFASEVHQMVVSGVDIRAFPMPDGWGVRFDLDFSVIPEGNGMAVLVAYSVDRFGAAWVRTLLEDFTRLAHTAAEDPEAPLTGPG